MDHIQDFLKNLRTDYNRGQLDIATAEINPVLQFAAWMNMALEQKVNDPNAFSLATISKAGRLSSRIVLLRNFDQDGFVFFTNYRSHKGQDLIETTHAAINFFWPELHKQVRIEGQAEKIAEWDSDAYFNSRPRESQLGAWVSEQSNELTNREELDQKFEILTKNYEGRDIERPPHWGGFRIRPVLFEFWQGRPNRLHDRLEYRLDNHAWIIRRLYP